MATTQQARRVRSPIKLAKRQLTLSTHHIHTLPIVILMPHSRCNCRCVMCDIWRANRNGQEIAPELLARHIESLRKLGVEWVVLSGGEALMHSNLWALCAQLKELPVKITLLSTGLLLKRYAADVVQWCDEVVVSLDGSRDVHDSIRNIPRAFERLAEGVAALKEIDPAFRVTGRCVVQRRNFDDLPNIVDAAEQVGLDQISFLAVDVSSSAFNRPKPWGDERISDVALSPNDIEALETIVDELIRRRPDAFASGFIAESPEKLRRIPRYFAALNGDGEFPRTECNAPWVSAVIETDGTVRPCFFHAAYGNVNDRPLGEILNSTEARAFRAGLDVTRDEICRKCVCTLNLAPTAGP
jgi:MoaA/NifB/PqqE/SkfB family radical SAM enzyme